MAGANQQGMGGRSLPPEEASQVANSILNSLRIANLPCYASNGELTSLAQRVQHDFAKGADPELSAHARQVFKGQESAAQATSSALDALSLPPGFREG